MAHSSKDRASAVVTAMAGEAALDRSLSLTTAVTPGLAHNTGFWIDSML